jgi:hypothetical protein
MDTVLNENIEVLGRRKHSKASEEFVDVRFKYGNKAFNWSIPIEYRRTGTEFSNSTDEEIGSYIIEVYEKCHPDNWSEFKKAQEEFWSTKPKASVTKEFFDALASDFSWKSVRQDLPSNSNSQRRIQDLKEFGFTIATDTRMTHKATREISTHHLLLPLTRGGITGYETWSPALRKRIIQVLGGIDAYEIPGGNVHNLLPDHKFPEIRWDQNVKRESLEKLSDEEIKRDFQLVTNQRNQQKREACRKCFHSCERPILFGINYYAKGEKLWPRHIPTRGKEAEEGCKGCGWYDISAWRLSLNEHLEED